MFNEKNEAVINSSLGLNGYNFQGAYSVSNNLAVLSNFRFYSDSSFGYRGQTFNKSYLGELGVGYFNAIDDYFKIELITGTGFDYNLIHQKVVPSSWERSVISRKISFFIQPSFGIRAKNIESIWSLRNYHIGYFLWDNKLNYVGFVEPAYTLRVGFKKFKLFSQVGFCVPYNLGKAEVLDDITYLNFYSNQYFNLTIGLNYRFRLPNTKKAPQ